MVTPTGQPRDHRTYDDGVGVYEGFAIPPMVLSQGAPVSMDLQHRCVSRPGLVWKTCRRGSVVVVGRRTEHLLVCCCYVMGASFSKEG